MATEIVPADVVEIQRAARLALRSLHRTMGMVQVTIRRLVTVGALLNRQRGETEHGLWMAWLEEYLPEVTYQTARNWMKLATYAETRAADLDSAQTVRQAYVLAGLLPEPEPSEGGSSAQQGNYLVHVARLERAIKTQIEARPLEEWSREDKQILRARLQPLAELFEKLEAA